MRTMKKINLVIGVVIIGIALMLSTSCKKKDSTNPVIAPVVFQPGSVMYGSSYSVWSATWWTWLMELPVAGNPSVDTVNFDVTAGQSGNVWFLAEPFTTLPITRTCTIPAGKALFVALLTAEASALEGFGTTDSLQRANAKFFADHIINLFATIDGVNIANLSSYRIASPQFTFTAPTPWLYGATGGTNTSVGDGYYLMFHPLSPGAHTLHYKGEFLFTVANGGFDYHAYVNMTYNLTVQ
jgi:hypothetical protein